MALLLAACTALDDRATSPTPASAAPSGASAEPPAPNLAVTVLQQRVDATTRIVGINTTNRGKAVVHVSAVRLTGAGLYGPVTLKDTDLQPHLTVALRTSYGRPQCDDRSGAVTAHLKIGGDWITYPVNAAGQREVRRVLDTDCAQLRLAATADVRLSGPYQTTTVTGQPYLEGRLLVERRSPGARVDVRSLTGTVLVDLRPVNRLVDLGPTMRSAVTPVLLGSTGRCDPHGLGQSTQTFLLSAYVRLGTEPVQRVVLEPRPPVQNQVLRVIDRACGTS